MCDEAKGNVQVSVLIPVYVLVQTIGGKYFITNLDMTICKLHYNYQTRSTLHFQPKGRLVIMS